VTSPLRLVGAIDSGAIDSGAIDSGAIDSGAIDSGAVVALLPEHAPTMIAALATIVAIFRCLLISLPCLLLDGTIESLSMVVGSHRPADLAGGPAYGRHWAIEFGTDIAGETTGFPGGSPTSR
jgi:hypothetical protein